MEAGGKIVSEIAVSLGINVLKKTTPIIVKSLFRKVKLGIQENIILSFNSLLPISDAQILLEEILGPVRMKKNGLCLLKSKKRSFMYYVSICPEPFILEEFLSGSLFEPFTTIGEIETLLPVSSIRIFLSPLFNNEVNKDELKNTLLEMYWLYRDEIDLKVQQIRKSARANLDSIFQIKLKFYDNVDKIIKEINKKDLVKERLLRFHQRNKEVIFRIDDTNIIEELVKVI